jgi:hypothetical protein
LQGFAGLTVRELKKVRFDTGGLKPGHHLVAIERSNPVISHNSISFGDISALQVLTYSLKTAVFNNYGVTSVTKTNL